MSLETDLILDRRRLKRRLITWRVVAVLAVVLAAIAVVGRIGFPLPGSRYVAVLHVTGIITDDEKRVRAVSALAADPDVAALMVEIDSPGGSVAGGEALHDAVAKVAAVKPVVTVMGGTAASAGYMIAVPAARIFARQSTITGSIGVIMEAPEFSGLLDKLGIDVQTLVSGPLKGQPSYSAPMTPAGHVALQSLLMDLYDQFVGMVATGRHMSFDDVKKLADGRAYTGRQAIGLHLVDQIGGEDDARAWLASAKKIPTDLPTRDVHARKTGVSFLGFRLNGLANLLFSQTVPLDGALALWQPSID
ncbi:signal peptide peptidase SppA [Acidisoma silvae]|uniref:Signal peptide peptidase SppA n=1 Tax=Acidisoma silvae TaxID=2802396 RepID=A0A964DXJ3_9PROT|nr:signal peptide peptidase SppA [Acidisoma silvae]MCB8874112.1 signal peptide peptidase SppA [Acidisoma silvae]